MLLGLRAQGENIPANELTGTDFSDIKYPIGGKVASASNHVTTRRHCIDGVCL